LAIEEWFYVAFPVICIALRRTGLVVIALLGIVVYSQWARGDRGELYFLGGNAGALALGCLVAFGTFGRKIRSSYATIMKVAGFGIIVIAGRLNVEGHLFAGPFFVAIGAAVVIAGAALCPIASVWWTQWIRGIGHRSYEIYLFHLAVITALVSLLGTPWYVVILASAFILLVSEIIGRFYSDPTNAHIRKLLLRPGTQEVRLVLRGTQKVEERGRPRAPIMAIDSSIGARSDA
jgi:peptidoglycan/LPS O-acetylase OafA/YrhL